MFLNDELAERNRRALALKPENNSNDSASFLAETQESLAKPQKTLACKYFYDERGSQLFDQICELDEYYVTRTELAIMEANADAIASVFEAGDVLVELGSGSSRKTRILLDLLAHLAAYVPVDISAEHLNHTADRLREAYPYLTVRPVPADYTKEFALPRANGRRIMVYFPGSTIGNFHPEEAIAFLRQIRNLVGDDGGLLIGADLRKDINVLNAAYNDQDGVTAEFNLNLLRRMNRELGSDFNVDCFEHRAFFNFELGRIEMHLVSKRDQTVHLGEGRVRFAEGETIWTECSYKHTLEGFQQIAGAAGFRVEDVWTDAKRWFSVQLLKAA